MNPESGGALFDAFAESYAEHARESVYNALYDRPAVLDLLGDVTGLRVLDAGCGPGYYAEELVRRGARVTAFDGSPGWCVSRRPGSGVLQMCGCTIWASH